MSERPVSTQSIICKKEMVWVWDFSFSSSSIAFLNFAIGTFALNTPKLKEWELDAFMDGVAKLRTPASIAIGGEVMMEIG